MENFLDGFVKALAGGVGSLVSTTLLYPMEVIRRRCLLSALRLLSTPRRAWALLDFVCVG